MFTKPAVVIATCCAAAGCASTNTGGTDPAPTVAALVSTVPRTTGPADPSLPQPTAATSSTTVSAATTTSVVPPAEVFDVAIDDGEFVDDARDRRIPYRTYAPVGISGEVPVVLVSHGGRGSDLVYRSGAHLGTTFAANGFLAIHIGHLPSEPGVHRIDRPADVSAVLDRLDAGTLDLPDAFVATATPDTTVGSVTPGIRTVRTPRTPSAGPPSTGRSPTPASMRSPRSPRRGPDSSPPSTTGRATPPGPA